MADLSARAGGLGRSAVSPQPYPVHPHGSGRYLVSPLGVPFPINGRVLWIHCPYLSVASYRAVLDEAAAKGFNAIEVKPPLAPAGTVPSALGNLPFSLRLDGGAWSGATTGFGNINLEAPDFTTPVEAYWREVDEFFKYAERRGLLVFYFPMYVGFENTDWWMPMMVANGATKMGTYGTFVATRYRNQKNLVWMLGGDQGTGAHPFSGPQAAVVEALNTALHAVATVSTEYACEWVRGSIGADLYESSLTLQPCYAGATDINNQGARGYAETPTRVAFFQEVPFDEDNGIERRFHYWAWLSTIGGSGLFGNGIYADPSGDVNWNMHNNTQGTQDLVRLNALIVAHPLWYTLVPMNTMITAGAGTANSDNQVVGAVNPAGTLGFVYRPPAATGTFTIDRTKMSSTITLRWYDPTDGSYTAIGTSPNTGTQVMTVPGTNAVGDNDWLLELNA